MPLNHIAQMLALGGGGGMDWWVDKPSNKWKTSLVIGGTRTRVLAYSMAITASIAYLFVSDVHLLPI